MISIIVVFLCTFLGSTQYHADENGDLHIEKIYTFPQFSVYTSPYTNYSHFGFQEVGESYVLYREPDGLFNLLGNSTMKILKSPTHILSNDSLQTIWLPTAAGGTILPDEFIYNPINTQMYVAGDWNIAVCDAQSGSLLSMIPTVRTRKEFAYSETNNKLYIANSFERTIDVIDCQNHQVIETIQLTDTITAAVWNAFSNEIYFTQHAPQQSDCHVELIDCTNDSIVTSIPTGGYPKNLHCNPMLNKVYCANAEDLLVIDGSTHKPVQRIPLDPSNNHLFTYNTVNHKLYCINVYADNISVIDGIGDTLIITWPLGSWPSCAAYNPIGNRVYVGHVFSEDVYVIDGNTNQITGYLNFGAMVTALAYASTDNRLFIVTAPTSSDDFYADMIVLDGTSHAILDTLETGVDPLNSVLWESEHNQVWVGNHGLLNLPGYTIDGYAADSLVHLFTTPVGFTPFAAILNPATNKYYGVGRSDDYVAILNLNNPDSVVLKETGECVWDVLLNPIDNKIYCANNTDSSVSILDGITDSIIAQVPIGSDVLSLEFNHADNKVYVGSLAEMQGGYITVIDGQTNSVLNTIATPMYPFSMLWTPTDNKLYIACYHGHAIIVLDAHSDTILATIPTPGYCPWSLAHNPTNDKIYSSIDNHTMIIDAVTNNVITTIHDAPAFAIAYNPVNNKVYCGGRHGMSGFSGVTIIDGATDSIIASHWLSKLPFSILYNPITNTVFCACVDESPWPPQEAIVVIDGVSDSVLADFLISSNVGAYGNFWGIPSHSRKALVLDSLTNTVYLNHYYSSKISVIDGTTGIHERTTIPRRSVVLQLFPNPAKYHVNIDISLQNSQNTHIEICDIVGRVLDWFDLPHDKSRRFLWDCCDKLGNRLPNGVYFVKAKVGNHSLMDKLVLIR